MASEAPANGGALFSQAPAKSGSNGMLVAAVVGALASAGLLGYVALRPNGAFPSGAHTATVQTANSATAAPEPTFSSTTPAIVKVRINSDPDGASLKEDGVELCSSTPCDILYKGSDADPTREHKLTLTRPGYRTEVKSVKVGDSPVTVKLIKAPEIPRFTPQPKVDTPAAVPTGYKTDVPY
jgi:serine/threonine-protein kinase